MKLHKLMMSTVRQFTLGASALAGLLVAQQAGAVTLPTVANGLGVYDSGLNVTWTSDANLLRTMELNPNAYGYNNLNGLLTAIVNASGGAIHDTPNYFDGAYNVNAPFDSHPGATSGSHPLSAADFGTSYGWDRPFGSADWFGAKAFVNFLNSIDYAGSNSWSLPTPDAACIVGSCVNKSSLTALGDNSPGHPYNNLQFTNTRGVDYPLWYDLEALNGNAALDYRRYYGGGNSVSYKYNYEGVWAVSPGQLGTVVGAVPEPGTYETMVAGLCVLGLSVRRSARRVR